MWRASKGWEIFPSFDNHKGEPLPSKAVGYLSQGGLRMSLVYKEDWKEAKSRLEAWWEGEVLDRVVIQVTAPRERPLDFKPLPAPKELEPFDPKGDWPAWSLARCLSIWGTEPENWDTEFIVNRYEWWFSRIFFGGESYPHLWLNFGPGVLAAYLTGYWRFTGDTVWFALPQPMEWEEILSLDISPESPLWRLTNWLAEELAKAGKGRFILGTTDIGGITDILVSLRHNENLMLDLYDHPEEVKAASERITNFWHKCYEELDFLISLHQEGRSAWMGIWSSKRWYSIQCDFSYMISPKMFEEFVLPYLAQQCRRLDRSVYHWDGPGQVPHLDHLLSIPELCAIQWTPGAGNPPVDEEVWFPLYKRIQEKKKGLVLLGVRPERVERLLLELKPEGLLMSVWCGSEEEARELLQKAKKWTARRKGIMFGDPRGEE